MGKLDNVPIVEWPLILANKCTRWQVYSALVCLVVYQISKVCLALMYIQHKHMVCDELHIFPFLDLGQNKNENAYSTPLRHEVWNVEHKMIILRIDLCYNTCSHIFVKHQHYTEHDTLCLSIFFLWIFFKLYLINDTIFRVLFCKMILEFLR